MVHKKIVSLVAVSSKRPWLLLDTLPPRGAGDKALLVVNDRDDTYPIARRWVGSLEGMKELKDG